MYASMGLAWTIAERARLQAEQEAAARGEVLVTDTMRWRAILAANAKVASGRAPLRMWTACYDGSIARQLRGEQP